MRTEFYTFESEVWFRKDGITSQLTEREEDVISELVGVVKTFYPKAYDALNKEYVGLSANPKYYRYKIAERFCKCNFGNIDNVSDIDEFGRFNFERVSCPMRGECRLEGIVCSSKFDSKITDSELRVMKLVVAGLKSDAIADRLYLSVFTVRNHIRNVLCRLGLHDRAEFVDYAHRNKLFSDDE
ncbi:MAG: helix-turn-helix transcriptional regulator [Bacteroidales bacterium]|nr:helix-turn-helix transcriptional regulator [Bacteroidales bacterium]